MQMKLMRIAAGLTAGLAALSAFAQIKWAPNFTEAMLQAKASKKLVMVEFFASWDPWSQRLESDTFKEATVIAFSKKVVPVRVNVEKDGAPLGKKYRIVNYPTVLFLDSNGNDVGMIDGFESEGEFVKHGEVFLKDYANYPKLLAQYKRNPKSLDAIVGLGTIEANRYHVAPAIAKLQEAQAIDPQNKTDKLSDLYNAIADHYQNAAKYDPAITYFKKAGDTTKATDKKAYAWLSIATCYMTMDAAPDPDVVAMMKPADRRKMLVRAQDHLKAALPFIEMTLKLPKLKSEDRRIAEDDKKTIDQGLKAIKAALDAPDDDGGQ